MNSLLVNSLMLIIMLAALCGFAGVYLLGRNPSQELQHEFLAFQDAANIGAWVWDIIDDKITFSDTAIKILNLKLPPNDISCSSFELLEYIHPDDIAEHKTAVKHTLRSGRVFDQQFRLAGYEIDKWIEARGEVTFDETNQPIEMIGMFKDITRSVMQKKIQERMKDILEKIIVHENIDQVLNQLCNAISELKPRVMAVICIKDTLENRSQIYHSQNCSQALIDYTNEFTTSEQVFEFQKVVQTRNRLYINDIHQSDAWQSRADLAELEVNEFYGQRLLSNLDQIKGLIAFYIAPSEQQYQLLDELLDLSSKVAEVAIDSQLQAIAARQIQHQLYQTQKMESIGHLTGGIAHDFNNILGSIVGYNGLAKKIATKAQDEKLMSYLDEVNVAASRAKDLISQMLIFSRSEPVVNVPVEVKPIVKEVISLVSSMIPSSISVTKELSIDLEQVSINPVTLHQVLMNFIINAKDAINKVGEIKVKASMQTISERKCTSCYTKFSGEYVCIEVADNGTGIKSELINKMFDPFFTTKEIGRGTGMGLSVVHGIVHDVEGHILVESEVNVGTSMKVFIPASDIKQIKLEQSSKKSSGALGSGQHILVVDDDVPLSLLFKELLTSYGYKVTRFDNSQLALEFYTKHFKEIDLVLSDQTMPLITGDEMAAKILELDPEQKIILCTGFSETLDATSASELGVNAVLEKPVDMYKLLDLVKSLLSVS
jgi:signal transduction histidine kinase